MSRGGTTSLRELAGVWALQSAAFLIDACDVGWGSLSQVCRADAQSMSLHPGTYNFKN